MSVNASSSWNLSRASQSVLSVSTLIFVGLIILSFPHYCNPHVCFALVFACATLSWQLSDDFFPDDFIQANLLRFLIMFPSHMFYLIYSKAQLAGAEHLHDTMSMESGGRWYRGYKLLFNPRGVKTKWQLRYLYPPQNILTTKAKVLDIKQKPGGHVNGHQSYWRSILIHLSYAFANYVVLCLYYEMIDLRAHMTITASDFSPAQEVLIRRFFFEASSVTQRELLIRFWMVLDKTIPEYLWLSSYHSFAASFCIAIGLDTASEWPPIFGPVSAANTVRGYWGIFWHRIIYKSFSSHAAKISSCFGMKKYGMINRHVENTLVFAFSGIMHGAVSWRLGNRCAWNRSLGYWMLQPLAFILEGMVQACWKGWLAKVDIIAKRPKSVKAFEGTIGYIWVFCWFFWCVPKRIYPLQYCGVE